MTVRSTPPPRVGAVTPRLDRGVHPDRWSCEMDSAIKSRNDIGSLRSYIVLRIGEPPHDRRRRRLARHHPADGPTPRAGKARGREAVRDGHGVHRRRGSADGNRGNLRGHRRRRTGSGAARRDRDGQDLHHGQGHRADPATRHHPRPQQDAGRAALRRVQGLLPEQRGRVFRQLLRLLPARSLRPAHRYVSSRRNPRSTRRSTGCATRRRGRCWSATT